MKKVILENGKKAFLVEKVANFSVTYMGENEIAFVNTQKVQEELSNLTNLMVRLIYKSVAIELIGTILTEVYSDILVEVEIIKKGELLPGVQEFEMVQNYIFKFKRTVELKQSKIEQYEAIES